MAITPNAFLSWFQPSVDSKVPVDEAMQSATLLLDMVPDPVDIAVVCWVKLLVQVLSQPPIFPPMPRPPMTNSSAWLVVPVVPTEQLLPSPHPLVADWSSGEEVTRPEYSKMLRVLCLDEPQ